ncbi:hypothetical protein DMENIID0001_121330 [Sergentomyia squamirostris]
MNKIYSLLLKIVVLCVIFASVLGRFVAGNPGGSSCVPGSSFMDENNCNRCMCSSDGSHYWCTLKWCPPRRRISNELRREPSSQEKWEQNVIGLFDSYHRQLNN